MGCGMKMTGILLFFFNLLLLCFGLALAAIGIWSVIDKMYVASVIGDDLFSAASYMVIVGGLILIAVAVFGICALRKERRRLVIIYFILLVVIFITLLLAAILAVAFKGELEEQMTNSMRSSVLNGYGADSSVTDAWDRLQRDLKCCGVRAVTNQVAGFSSGNENMEVTRQDSWLLFERTRWYQNARLQNLEPVELVPRSCCVFDEKVGDFRDVLKCQTWRLGPPGNLRIAIFNNALHYDGCYEKAKSFIGEQADILLACAFTFAACMVGGMVLTLMLYRLLGQHTRVIRD